MSEMVLEEETEVGEQCSVKENQEPSSAKCGFRVTRN